MKHGFLKILTEEECKKAIKGVEDLYQYWVRIEPEPVDFYTLGAVSHQEGMWEPDKYIEKASKMNPILKEKFGWIYDKVLEKLSEKLGPCELIDPLGYPGFHILGHPPNQANNQVGMLLATRPLTRIHSDQQYDYPAHRKVWKDFKNVKYSNTMSWTLSIEMPKCGSCLGTWDNEEMKQYEQDQKLADYVKSIPDYEDFKDHRPPDYVVSYRTGELFFFHGLMKHQIAPAYETHEYDRRITMQGHGTQCDGIWRIYF